jgi:hypothetical protein
MPKPTIKTNRFFQWPLAMEQRCTWIAKKDAKRKPTVSKLRGKTVSPLTKISEKYYSSGYRAETKMLVKRKACR